MGSITENKKHNVWGRYWIIGGLEVVHRNDITDLNIDRLSLMKMTVDRVIKRSKGNGDDKRKVFIEGVRTHWIDNERKYQVGQFHTTELVPYDVACKGIVVVNKWLERSYD